MKRERERERERQNIFKTQVDWSLVEILPARIRVFLLSCRIDDDGIPRSSSPLDNHYHPRAPLWTTTTTTNGMHHCGCPLPSIIMPQINYYHGHNNEISRRRCIMSRLTTNHNNHDEGTLWRCTTITAVAQRYRITYSCWEDWVSVPYCYSSSIPLFC